MSNQYLKLRRSSVPGKIPATSSIDFGELALNTVDGKVYMKITSSLGQSVIAVNPSSMTGSLFGTASFALNSDYSLRPVSYRGTSLYSTIPLTQNVSPSYSIFLGEQAGQNTTSSVIYAVYLGYNAGYSATNATASVFIGLSPGYQSDNAHDSVFIGTSAGSRASYASSSVFIGKLAGYQAASASYSILLGYNVGRNTAANTGIGNNNIIIGNNITLEDNRKDSINIGSIIFATGSNFSSGSYPYSGSSIDGKVGINVVKPQYTLDVSGSGNFSGPLYATVTGSLYGTSSWATNAVNSLSTITSSYALSASYSNNSTTSSYALSASYASISINSTSASYAATSSWAYNVVSASNSQTASYALTASNAPNYLPLAGGTVTGNLNVLGTASIAYLNVVYQTSSVIYSSGSNQFGDAFNDVQTLYGTVNLPTGSLNVLSGAVNATLFSGSGASLYNIPASAIVGLVTGSGGGGTISGSGTAGQVTYWSGTSAVTGSATLTYTPTTSLLVNNSVTASSAIARGVNFTPTLTATANNDVLVGLYIAPTFTNGAFTGVTNYSLRLEGDMVFNGHALLNISLPSRHTQTTGFKGFWPGANSSLMASTATGFEGILLNSNLVRHSTLAWTCQDTTKPAWQLFLGYGTDDFGIVRTPATSSTGTFTTFFYIKGTTGNVLINNATDAGYRLDINGTGATAGALRVSGSSLFDIVTGSLSVTSGSSTFLFVSSSGNVGIGTTSPLSPLHVVYSDNSYNNIVKLQNTNAGTNSYVGITLLDRSGSNAGQFAYIPSNYINAALQNTVIFNSSGLQKLGFVANASGIGAAQDIYFLTQASNANYQMQIKGNTGNVQIGTNTDSGFRLDVSGSTRITTGLTVSGSGGSAYALTTTNGWVQFGSTTGLTWDNTNSRLGIGTNAPGNSIHLSEYNTTNSQVRIAGLELQSYDLNNAWIGDNVYYNGTNFVRRSTGFAGMFYFAGREGQFRFGSTGAGGTTITDGITSSGLTPLKVCLSGTVAIGGDISTIFDVYTGAKMLITGSTGNVVIQNGGTFTDNGYRLDVNASGSATGGLRVVSGSTLLVGAGNTSATNALVVQSSDGVNSLAIRNDGLATFRGSVIATTITANSSLLLGTSADSGYRLQINPSGSLSGSLLISGSNTQPTITGNKLYSVDLRPTMIYTTGSQTQTALRVLATFSGSTAFTSSQSNIIADFGASSVGSQLIVNDITSGSIYMVNDASGLPIIESTSAWDVLIYDYPYTVFKKTGSMIELGVQNQTSSYTLFKSDLVINEGLGFYQRTSQVSGSTNGAVTSSLYSINFTNTSASVYLSAVVTGYDTGSRDTISGDIKATIRYRSGVASVVGYNQSFYNTDNSVVGFDIIAGGTSGSLVAYGTGSRVYQFGATVNVQVI